MKLKSTRRLAGFNLAAAAVTLAVASAPASAARPSSAHVSAINAATPCVGLSGARSRIRHVIVLFMENQPYNAIIGSPEAPYINGLAQRCGLATNYHNITHPSAPEYLAATSGQLGGAGDCPPVFLDPSWPPTCADYNENIFSQAMAAGETWKNYEESMATNSSRARTNPSTTSTTTPPPTTRTLAVRAAYPTRRRRFDVPMGTPQAGNFETDLVNGTLPNYSFIAPNLIHDTHDSTVAAGDEYLSELIPTILDSREYQDGSTVLFVVWDEGEGGSTDRCAYNTTDVGCHVAMVVVSP